jgi:serine/threonine protein kinase
VGAYGKVYQVVLKNQLREGPMRSSNLAKEGLAPLKMGEEEKKGECYAIKVIEKKLILLENKNHEINIEIVVLTNIKSRLVVEMYSSFQDSIKVYFLMEFISNGTLLTLLNRERILKLDLVRHISAELVLSLEVLRKY